MTKPQDESPILHVDDDWKAQAQAEKARLAEKEKAAKQQQAASGEAASAQAASQSAGSGAPGQIPPADFNTLISSIATNALFAMGAMPDPQTGQRYTNLDIARHHIDSLGVLEDKTKGNLTQEEAKTLASTLYELRQSYVQIANASRSPATGGPSH